MKIILFPLILLFLGACTSGRPTPVQKITSQHGGTLLKGQDHYLEVVATENEIKLYPLQDTGKKLEPLQVEGASAKYSPVLSKTDWVVDLGKRGDALIGDIEPRGNKELNVKVDLMVDGKKESFFQRIPVESKIE